MNTPPTPRRTESCPDDTEIAAYIDRRLGPDAAAIFRRHAATCAACSRLIAEALNLLRVAPSRNSRRSLDRSKRRDVD